MKSKKHLLAAMLVAACMALISFNLMPPDGPAITETEADQSIYETQPPYPLEYWIQKLVNPLSDGRNMIVRIHYICDNPLPTTIKFYQGDGSVLAFKDNGVFPDQDALDGIYAVYVKEDIPALLSQIQTREAVITSQGGYTHFNGHFGEEHTVFTAFDVENFTQNNPVPLGNNLLDVALCTTELKKQQSLFVTALSVVEDPSRTYNVATGTGNPKGVWTFGNLIKNIVNAPAPASKNFLKNWVKGWIAGRDIGGQTVPARPKAFVFLIEPWLEKAYGVQDGGLSASYQGSSADGIPANWETIWDNASEEAILDNAPFKLMAIVNRIDLRGNASYKVGLSNAGETRFIYTLIAPITYDGPDGLITPAGQVPINSANDNLPNGHAGNANLLDWKGMNVILEFGNPQNNICDLQSFGKDWLDLSDPAFGNPFDQSLGNAANREAYNAALESITHRVVDANNGPADKVNGSCLNRIRTNERIFYPVASGCCSVNAATWHASDWELSQFELDASTHQLAFKPVTNTPMLDANYMDAENGVPYASIRQPLMKFNAGGFTTDQYHAAALIDWVFRNKIAVATGGHILPASYSTTWNGNPVSFTQAPTALVTGEGVHFWDLFWEAQTPYYSPLPQGAPKLAARNLRKQLSINTCQGCHAGENKTFFTQIRPVGYGVATDYWGTIPESDYGDHDVRFVTNTGRSFEHGLAANNYQEYDGSNGFPLNHVRDEQRVSAFLTGRVFRGGSDWADDDADDVDGGPDDPTDPIFGKGMFKIHDPANNKFSDTNDETRPNPAGMNSFNDLEDRKVKLCNFVNMSCKNGVLPILIKTGQIYRKD